MNLLKKGSCKLNKDSCNENIYLCSRLKNGAHILNEEFSLAKQIVETYAIHQYISMTVLNIFTKEINMQL